MDNQAFEHELSRLHLRRTPYETTHMRRWDHDPSGAGVWVIKGESATDKMRVSALASVRRRLLGSQ